MTLGLTFLSLMSAYWWKNYILNFKKLINLTLRDTLERTPKVSVIKIYSVGFNPDADHDAEISCKRITQSDWPWKFQGRKVFHYSRVGVVLPLSVKKWPNLHPSESTLHPYPKSLHSPNFYFIITWSWGLKNNTKNGYKNLQQQNKWVFLGNLYKIFCSVHFYKNL